MAFTSHLFEFDRSQTSGPQRCLAGVDEAGRGPLAGPVVAAAVFFIRPVLLPGLNDSKKVTPKNREILFWEIAKNSLTGIGMVGEQDIDHLNIYQATRVAMRKAVLALTRTPDLVVIDGTIRLDLPIPQRSVIRGDQKSASIAAASIVAKVFRDAWMRRLDRLFPLYLFKEHKGYATEKHLRILKEVGPSPVHRRSFYPVKAYSKDKQAENETLVKERLFSDLVG